MSKDVLGQGKCGYVMAVPPVRKRLILKFSLSGTGGLGDERI